MLANYHTHTTFCDGKNTPEEIVRYAKMSIPDIFATKGEEEFRNIESVVLEKCLRYDAVIATGESALYANIMLQKGVVVE